MDAMKKLKNELVEKVKLLDKRIERRNGENFHDEEKTIERLNGEALAYENVLKMIERYDQNDDVSN